MTQQEFQACIDKCQYKIEEIREHAHMLHDSVNQRYDMNHPYSYHLDMVADLVFKYGHLVCQQEGDVLPLFFGAFYHDSIEDARMTYNDVTKGARLFMSDDQAYMAAEMVYALTNEKGRTRAERANDRYYARDPLCTFSETGRSSGKYHLFLLEGKWPEWQDEGGL